MLLLPPDLAGPAISSAPAAVWLLLPRTLSGRPGHARRDPDRAPTRPPAHHCPRPRVPAARYILLLHAAFHHAGHHPGPCFASPSPLAPTVAAPRRRIAPARFPCACSPRSGLASHARMAAARWSASTSSWLLLLLSHPLLLAAPLPTATAHRSHPRHPATAPPPTASPGSAPCRRRRWLAAPAASLGPAAGRTFPGRIAAFTSPRLLLQPRPTTRARATPGAMHAQGRAL